MAAVSETHHNDTKSSTFLYFLAPTSGSIKTDTIKETMHYGGFSWSTTLFETKISQFFNDSHEFVFRHL